MMMSFFLQYTYISMMTSLKPNHSFDPNKKVISKDASLLLSYETNYYKYFQYSIITCKLVQDLQTELLCIDNSKVKHVHVYHLHALLSFSFFVMKLAIVLNTIENKLKCWYIFIYQNLYNGYHEFDGVDRQTPSIFYQLQPQLCTTV